MRQLADGYSGAERGADAGDICRCHSVACTHSYSYLLQRSLCRLHGNHRPTALFSPPQASGWQFSPRALAKFMGGTEGRGKM